MQIHQQVAIKTIFGSQIVKDFKISSKSETISSELISRIGLMTIKENGEFEFMHQTIAEFFVSEFIFYNITKETLLSSNSEFIELIGAIFMDVECETIQILLNEKNIKSCKVLAIYRNNKNLTRMVLEAAETLMNSNEFKEFLKQEDKETNTAFLLSATINNANLFAMIWKSITRIIDDKGQKQLLMQANSGGVNVLMAAISNDNENVIAGIFNALNNICTEHEQQNILMQDIFGFQNNILMAVAKTSLATFNTVLGYDSSILDVVDFKKLLLDKMETEKIF